SFDPALARFVFEGERDLVMRLPSGERVSLRTGPSTRVLRYLARARGGDEARGIAPGEAGWRSVHELCQALPLRREEIERSCARAEEVLAGVGIEAIIERHLGGPLASRRIG